MAGTAGGPHQQAHRRRWRGRHGLRQRAAGRLFRLRAARRRGCAARPVARLRARRRWRAGRQRAGRVRRGGRRGAAHDARRKRPRRGDRVRLGQVEELVRRQDQTAAAAHPARRRARALRAGRDRVAPGGAGIHRIWCCKRHLMCQHTDSQGKARGVSLACQTGRSRVSEDQDE